MIKHPLRSGNQYVDWFFRAIKFALDEYIEEIKWEPNAYFAREYGSESKVFADFDGDTINFNADLVKKRDDKIKYLIHEAVHCVIGDIEEMNEKLTDEMMDMLWCDFTEQQKFVLSLYIPPKPRRKKTMVKIKTK